MTAQDEVIRSDVISRAAVVRLIEQHIEGWKAFCRAHHDECGHKVFAVKCALRELKEDIEKL